MKRARRVALAVANDPHSGGLTALLPPGGARLDTGNQLAPNLGQLWLWERWVLAWRRAAELAEGCDERVLVLNGDLTDGWHHQTAEIATRNVTIQKRIAREVLAVPLDTFRPRKRYAVRGTAAHVGEQAEHEEDLAEKLGCVPDPDTGAHSRGLLDIEILDRKIQALHHGSIGRLPWTEQAALDRAATAIHVEHVRHGKRSPDLVAVAHRHRWGASNDFTSPTKVLMAPGWQLATQYVHRVSMTPRIVHVGIWVVILERGGPMACHPIRFAPRDYPQEVAVA